MTTALLDPVALADSPALVRVPRPGSRVARFAQPLAAAVVEELAVSAGVCVRPKPMKVTDAVTGETWWVDFPCGATMERKCPSCAKRAARLRAEQCRTGWHATSEPVPDPGPATTSQRQLAAQRADLTRLRDVAAAAGDRDAVVEAVTALGVIDDQLTNTGVRGTIERAGVERRSRSTRRRQDAPDLPDRPSNGSTLGRMFLGRGNVVFRPSMFITLTLPSYGPVWDDGTPKDPARYDYVRAARDAVHFPKLIDRWFQNVRRCAGYHVQYFATLEPQRRLAPHVHIALRGTIPRALITQVTAATYQQVWWPPTDTVTYGEADPLPEWSEDIGEYLDPGTGATLTSWEEALDQLGEDQDAEPLHVVRFGPQVDVQGLLAGTPEADRRIGYLCKYLTKDITHCHGDTLTGRQRAHADRMAEALRFEPCSPTCPNWLRYGVQPKNPKPGMPAGRCTSKAHHRNHLGLGGRRVLVSRKWSGKTLTDHRHDRRAFVQAALTHLTALHQAQDQATDSTGDGANSPVVVNPPGDQDVGAAPGRDPRLDEPGRLLWTPARPDDPIPPRTTRLLHAIARRRGQRAQYERALALARGEPPPAAAAPITTPPPPADLEGTLDGPPRP